MFEYLIELIAQEEIRYKKNPDAYDKELKEYSTNLSSQITVPANRVNAFMAMSIMGVVSAREAITAGNPIKIYGNNWFDEAKYLWTSFMILGWILPNKKFDHRAIRVLVNDPRISSDGDQKDINSQLGYFSRFSRTSLYETEFKPLLDVVEIKRFLRQSTEFMIKKSEDQKKQQLKIEELRIINERKRSAAIEAEKLQTQQNAIRVKNEAFLSICKQTDVSLEMIDSHLANKAQIDYQDYSGNTALMYAIRSQNDRLAEYLLTKKGSNPFLVNQAGETALTLVAKQSPLFSMLRDLEHKKWLQHPPTTLQLNIALHEELYSALPKTQKIKQLLELGAEINYQDDDGYTGLMFVVDRQNESIVRYLLNQGANPLLKNKHGEIASDLAATSSNIFKILKGYELLEATSKNDLKIVKSCLSAGAELNFQGQKGMTPLFIAVEKGLIQMTNFFLEKGADLTITNQEGKDIFELVTDEEIARLLQSAKTRHEDCLVQHAIQSKQGTHGFFTAPQVTVQEQVLNNLILKSASDPNSAFSMAEIYEQGKLGVSPSIVKALEFYIKASSLGHANASFRLATIFELGNQEVSSDLNKSFSYYAFAARQNHLDAKKHLEQLAHAGNAQAQFALGYEYYRVINNILDATYWCTHASIQEHELACNYLKNTPFDAAVYFKIASQYESAKIHQAQNQKRAISFYTEAFKLNHQDAGVKLGNFYLYGYGEIKQDRDKAFSYFMKAAALGRVDILEMLEKLGEEACSQEKSEALAEYYSAKSDYKKAVYWRAKSIEEPWLKCKI